MKKIYLNLILLFASSCLIAQVDRSKMPEPGPAPAIDLGETQSFTLENGLKVFVVENHKLPRVAYSLQLDLDPIKEGDKAGAANIAGDLLSKGTKNRTKDELNFAIDFIGASFGTSATSVFGASLKKHQNTLLEIMADVVKNPNFQEEELKKLKTQYISNIQTQKDDPDAIASNVRRVLLYGKDHPYGEINTEETIENVTLEDATSFYNTYFKPNVAYLAVVGDINLKEAKELVEKYFGDWKKGEVPTHKYDFPKQPSMPQVAFVNKPGAVQSVVSVFNTIDLKPGSEDAIKATITNGILGGGFVSKLNLNLREEHSYTYGARSSISSDELVGFFNATAKVRNEVTDSALTEMLNEIANMQKGEITKDELTTIKNYRNGTFAIGLENAQTKAAYAINIDQYNLPKDYYSNYLKNVATITLDNVIAVSKKYMNLRKGFILIVGNQEEVADKIKAFSASGIVKFYDSYGNEVAETSLKPIPDGINAEKVMKSYIEAIGGEKALSKVKSLKTVMNATMSGMSFTLTSINAMPNKFLSKMAMGEQVMQKRVYNGSVGQSMNMREGKRMMTEDELQSMKTESLPFPELAFLGEGYQMTLKGIDSKYKEDAYVIDIEKPDGKTQTNYYSTATGLKVASEQIEESQGQDFMLIQVFSDYKEVKKVKFPYSIDHSEGPMSLDISISEIKVNEKYDDSIFEAEK